MSDDSESWKGKPEQPRGESFEDRIKHLLDRDPFQPFEIVMSSGDKYLITDRFAMAIGRTSMATIYPPKGGMGIFRKSQIIGVEIPEPAA